MGYTALLIKLLLAACFYYGELISVYYNPSLGIAIALKVLPFKPFLRSTDEFFSYWNYATLPLRLLGLHGELGKKNIAKIYFFSKNHHFCGKSATSSNRPDKIIVGYSKVQRETVHNNSITATII